MTHHLKLLGTTVAVVASALMSAAPSAEPVTAVLGGSAGRIQSVDAAATPRRVLIDRLIGDQTIAIDWVDPAFAEEPVSGHFRGPFQRVVRQILGNANYIVAYEGHPDGTQTPSRLVIMGLAKGRDPAMLRPATMPGPAATSPAGSGRPSSAPDERAAQPMSPSDGLPPRLPGEMKVAANHDTTSPLQPAASGGTAAAPSPIPAYGNPDSPGQTAAPPSGTPAIAPTPIVTPDAPLPVPSALPGSTAGPVPPPVPRLPGAK